MTALATLQHPASVALTLRTLTPLYTGGVGQHGDQIHPSGLMGGIRRFSCLLAAAVGDASFEYAVWGTPTDAKKHHAKRIALRIDASGLKEIRPVAGNGRINWPRSDGEPRQGWYYNAAHEGTLRLTLIQRGISDPHWQLLLLALRIQIRHATFGSRDQWGLGVLAADALPDVEPLQSPLAAPLPDKPGLHRAIFAEIRFANALPQSWQARLEQGLRWREHLRGNFRQPSEKDLRHYLFGQLNQHGSAVNVSALYPHNTNGCALRIWGVIPHTTPPRFAEQRSRIGQTLREAIQQREPAGVLPGARTLAWQDGLQHPQDLAQWINQLAGVVA